MVMVYTQYVINIAQDVSVVMHVVLRYSHGFQQGQPYRMYIPFGA
jgi:hypothetical protein